MQNKVFLVGDAVKFAMSVAKDNLVLILVIVLISMAANSFFIIFDAFFVPDESVFSIFTAVVSGLISSGIYLGYTKIYIDLYAQKEGNVSDILSRFDATLFKFVVASIIYAAVVAVGLVLLVAPGVYLAVRLGFYSMILAEKPETEITESLKISWKITQGSTRNLLVLAIAILGINILGALALLVGLLFTLPVSVLASVYSYKKLSLAFGGTPTKSFTSPKSPISSTENGDLVVYLNKPKMKISSR